MAEALPSLKPVLPGASPCGALGAGPCAPGRVSWLRPGSAGLQGGSPSPRVQPWQWGRLLSCEADALGSAWVVSCSVRLI